MRYRPTDVSRGRSEPSSPRPLPRERLPQSFYSPESPGQSDAGLLSPPVAYAAAPVWRDCRGFGLTDQVATMCSMSARVV